MWSGWLQNGHPIVCALLLFGAVGQMTVLLFELFLRMSASTPAMGHVTRVQEGTNVGMLREGPMSGFHVPECNTEMENVRYDTRAMGRSLLWVDLSPKCSEWRPNV